MKTFAAAFVLASVAVTVTSVQAQVLQPSTVNGAIVGGIAGAVIGNNSGDLHHNAWKGAAIGTAAGAIVGSAVGDSRYRNDRGSSDRTRVGVSVGYGGYYGRPHWGGRYYYGSPRFGYSYDFYNPGYGYDYGYPSVYYPSSYDADYYQPNYSASGLLLGGVAGAIIGNNSHSHNTWRGAAIGAGAGWLIGTIADQNYRRRAVEVVAPQREPAETTPATATNSPQNVTIINNYYGNSTPMASANSMFGR